MGMSETIIAAAIGALATITTALFQLFSALRTKSKVEIRPKKGRTVRSVVAIAALMVASAVGGYLVSEFRQQRTADDMRSMREELSAKLQALTQTTERLASGRGLENGFYNSVEATLFARGCEGGACSEAAGERSALCGVVPSNAQVGQVDLFIGDAQPPAGGQLFRPEYKRVQFEQDGGGAKFTGAPAELAQDERGRTVCVDFVHWSAQPHIARMIVQFAAQGLSAGSAPGASLPVMQSAAMAAK